MGNNKKQTAVEWLIDELDLFEQGRSEYFSKSAIINQSFRLEKQQIIDAYNQDLYGGLSNNRKFENGKQYYNETFE